MSYDVAGVQPYLHTEAAAFEPREIIAAGALLHRLLRSRTAFACVSRRAATSLNRYRTEGQTGRRDRRVDLLVWSDS